MNILLVGNNPAEVEDIYLRLQSFKRPSFITEIAFDLRNIFKRIRQFKPSFILIDDRFSRRNLNRLIKRIHRNPNTCDIPVTVLKSDNRDLHLAAEIDNYMLKSSLSPASLRTTILNSRRFRKSSIYMYRSYKRSRNLLQKIWMDIRHTYAWFDRGNFWWASSRCR